MFGSGGFGQNTSAPAFGQQPQTPIFGQSQNLNPNAGNLNLTSSPGIFGTPQRQQGLFGAGQASSTPVQQQNVFGATSQPNTLFGTSQQPQQNLFGQTSSASALNLFGSNTGQQAQPNLFGSNTSQPQQNVFGATSQPNTLFGTGQQPQQNLFGQTSVAPSQAPTLFGSTQQSSAPSFGITGQATSLFGQNTTASSAQSVIGTSQPSLFGSNLSQPPPSTISSQQNLLGSLNQQKTTPLFGSNTGQTPLLSVSSTATSQQNLFGANVISSQPNAAGGMFGQQQQVSANSVFGKPLAKNSPLENEVQPVFKNLLQELRAKIKENAEDVLKFESNSVKEPDSFRDCMANANHFIKTVKSNSDTLSADAQASITAVTNEVCNCKALIEIHRQQKLHPSQASDQLCHLLLKIGNNLHSKIAIINDRVYELEYPLRDYIAWKENGMEPETINRQELLDHVNQFVSICNLAYMNVTELDNKIEQLKILYSSHIQKSYGRSKSPFESLKEKKTSKSEPFEYDPHRGMRAPNIFPSTASLLSLVGSMQKSVNNQQQSSLGFGAFQPQQQSNSIFGGVQRPAPFSLGGATQPSTQLSLNTGSLFNRPLSAPTSISTTTPTLSLSGQSTITTKPAFQLPALNTTTPTFGSTLNSSSSGTLFGGSASKSPLFGAK